VTAGNSRRIRTPREGAAVGDEHPGRFAADPKRNIFGRHIGAMDVVDLDTGDSVAVRNVLGDNYPDRRSASIIFAAAKRVAV
jgi:hypothetical protein